MSMRLMAQDCGVGGAVFPRCSDIHRTLSTIYTDLAIQRRDNGGMKKFQIF
jgi:hypothetical protein